MQNPRCHSTREWMNICIMRGPRQANTFCTHICKRARVADTSTLKWYLFRQWEKHKSKRITGTCFSTRATSELQIQKQQECPICICHIQSYIYTLIPLNAAVTKRCGISKPAAVPAGFNQRGFNQRNADAIIWFIPRAQENCNYNRGLKKYVALIWMPLACWENTVNSAGTVIGFGDFHRVLVF